MIFDLVNAPVGVITDPTLINAAAANSIQDKNVTTLAIEVHKSCLTQGNEPVIGGWTTASVRQNQTVSRSHAAERPPDLDQRTAVTGSRCRAWACPWSTRW